MNIDEAALATRKYFVACLTIYDRADTAYAHGIRPFHSPEEVQAAADRMNLRAVLEAILEPNTVMLCAGVDADDGQTGIERIKHIHRAMIGALIAEVGK